MATNTAAYRKAWAAKHPDKVREYGAKYRAAHIEQLKESHLVYRAANRDEIENRRRLKRYGITPIEHAALLRKQGGGCAICGRKDGCEGRKLATDHNHETGKVRGLLCYVCNTKIVVTVERFPSLIAKACEYLKEN